MEKFIVMYHGLISPERDIKSMLELLKVNNNICGFVMGDGDAVYVNELRYKALQDGIGHRVLFHKAVKQEKLWEYIGAADVGLVLARATNMNFLFSLPNKFFENIQGGTPIICPEYPEMKALIDKYEIGLTCDPDNIMSINACVERMRTDKAFYNRLKKNIEIARDEMCWENEKKALKEAYREIMEKITGEEQLV